MCFFKVILITILFAFCIIIDLGSCRHHGRHHKHMQHESAEWDKFKSSFNKKYKHTEENNRKTIFESNLKEVTQHNELYKKGLVSYKMAINEFADMSHDEFINFYTIKNNRRYLWAGHKLVVQMAVGVVKFFSGDRAPAEVRWNDDLVKVAGCGQRRTGRRVNPWRRPLPSSRRLSADMIREYRNKSKGYFAGAGKHNHHRSKKSVGFRHYLFPKHVPSHFDWRDKGAVTPVKQQRWCGSCYAFSAVGAIEAQYFLKGHKLRRFSEQNIIDCSSKVSGNTGCDGGYANNVFEYLMNKEYQVGLQTEREYEYIGREWKCLYNMRSYRKHYRSGPSVEDYEILKISEETLKEKIATHGPVAVELDSVSVQFYSEDVFYHENCTSVINGSNGLHAMLVVGYGSDEKQGDYWILKNSYGKNWGENGYMRLARNRDNHCGIANNACIVYLK